MPVGANFNLDTLKRAVDAGEIDTVLVAFPDMQGRLVGKRITGRFFLEHASHEMHVCDYLLTVDMEMEPVPGFRAASWETGYGDFAVRPDMATLRRIPWLEGTALVLGDCVDHQGQELAHSPRAMQPRFKKGSARCIRSAMRSGPSIKCITGSPTPSPCLMCSRSIAL